MSFDPVSQTISIAPILPATAVILCAPSFVNTLAQVELEVARLAIVTAQDAQSAANLLQRLTGAGGVLEQARKTVKQPFLDKCKEIDLAAQAPATRIEAAKRLIKSKVTAYEQEQAEIARKAEVARQAELRRLEEIQRQEQAERDRKAAELARQAAIAQEAARIAAEAAKKAGAPVALDVDWDDAPQEPPPKTETELAIERVKFAPVVAAPRPVGVTFKTFLIIESVDAAKLPDTFVTREPKLAAIRQTFCVGWKAGDAMPECPGVSFKIDKQVNSTGRSSF